MGSNTSSTTTRRHAEKQQVKSNNISNKEARYNFLNSPSTTSSIKKNHNQMSSSSPSLLPAVEERALLKSCLKNSKNNSRHASSLPTIKHTQPTTPRDNASTLFYSPMVDIECETLYSSTPPRVTFSQSSEKRNSLSTTKTHQSNNNSPKLLSPPSSALRPKSPPRTKFLTNNNQSFPSTTTHAAKSNMLDSPTRNKVRSNVSTRSSSSFPNLSSTPPPSSRKQPISILEMYNSPKTRTRSYSLNDPRSLTQLYASNIGSILHPSLNCSYQIPLLSVTPPDSPPALVYYPKMRQSQFLETM